MSEQPKPTNLQQMLDRIAKAERESDEQVTLEAIVTEVGRRSFGPLLLVPGLITLMPVVGDIPGVPTVMGMLVLLVAGQLLLRRRYFWLPDWLLRRSVARSKLHKALQWARPPARFLDRFLRPRLLIFTHGIGAYLIAVFCVLIALAMPPMEVVPFTANGAGVALTLFGLSLMADDGLLALLAFLLTTLTIGLVFYNLV